MPQLVARTCFQQPDLGTIWERIRRDGVQPFQEVVLDAIPMRNYKILNPELGLYAEYDNPFLVLEAYEDMYAALFAARDDCPRMAGSTCLFYIGQPGIGKTMFMLYAFVRCCQENRPLALYWRFDKVYYLPVDDEPELLEGLDEDELDDILDPQTVILCDSNADVVQPPCPLRLAGRLLAVAATPEATHWQWAREDVVALAYYVPLPTNSDIAALAQTVGGADGDRIIRLQALIGPSLRDLMHYRRDPDDIVYMEYYSLAKAATQDLPTLTEPRDLAKALRHGEVPLEAPSLQAFEAYTSSAL